jgi:hypothetical protein
VGLDVPTAETGAYQDLVAHMVPPLMAAAIAGVMLETLCAAAVRLASPLAA